MEIGSPIEEQCVRMFRLVYGNAALSLDDARRGFWIQHPAIIDGWERLAKSVMEVTTPKTFNHVSGRWFPTQEEEARMSQ